MYAIKMLLRIISYGITQLIDGIIGWILMFNNVQTPQKNRWLQSVRLLDMDTVSCSRKMQQPINLQFLARTQPFPNARHSRSRYKHSRNKQQQPISLQFLAHTAIYRKAFFLLQAAVKKTLERSKKKSETSEGHKFEIVVKVHWHPRKMRKLWIKMQTRRPLYGTVLSTLKMPKRR